MTFGCVLADAGYGVSAAFRQALSARGLTWAVGIPCIQTAYTALDTICAAERLHLGPITTPVASPESNGMSEAFVNTVKRNHVSGADRGSATAILDAIPAWIADYNAVAPHSVLGFRAPQQYRAAMRARV